MHNESIRYRINQMTDTGTSVNLALSEDIELEPVSQQQMMLEAVDRAVTDKEVKEQIRPLLEAILNSKPKTLIRTYQQTLIQITIPKSRYEKMASPPLADKWRIEIRKA